MKKNILEIELIAERQFSYTTEQGKETLIIKLGKPRLDSNPNGDWECPFQIGENIKLAYGVDSFQALSIAIQMLSVELRYLNDKQKMNIQWLGMDDLGM